MFSFQGAPFGKKDHTTLRGTSQTRILCMINHKPTNDDRAEAVLATWAKRCDGYAFVSTQQRPGSPTVVLENRTESRQILWAKVQAMIRYHIGPTYSGRQCWLRVDEWLYLVRSSMRRYWTRLSISLILNMYFCQLYNERPVYLWWYGHNHNQTRVTLKNLVSNLYSITHFSDHKTFTGVLQSILISILNTFYNTQALLEHIEKNHFERDVFEGILHGDSSGLQVFFSQISPFLKRCQLLKEEEITKECFKRMSSWQKKMNVFLGERFFKVGGAGKENFHHVVKFDQSNDQKGDKPFSSTVYILNIVFTTHSVSSSCRTGLMYRSVVCDKHATDSNNVSLCH